MTTFAERPSLTLPGVTNPAKTIITEKRYSQ